ncbi:hypothetical protein RBU49_01105 [Clostridium sp. MB40-C1]|uniref:hypothetical protein n=1 Tax=Clostridium sp. MB40-C1 TaxID=3070996 RepID=UPI0027E05285|nr:hypothetical protein [Clostridium sp. MB40-C1]WMJ80877.1 hypothetical protein RBU49_01105 [Clostridium sp. MB40-C1]
MKITSFSLSYLFLGVFVISLMFFIYFKVLMVKTESEGNEKEKIIGTMKDPDTWKKRNNLMSYISAFWCVLSLILFIYIKFFYKTRLINIIYFFIYLAVIVLSIIFIVLKKKEPESI